MNLVVFFDRAEAALVSLVGGKGRNLMALVAAGFPVPPGFIVTADAYRQFLAAAPWLEQELATLDYDHPDRLRDQCATLRHRLNQVPLPADVQLAVRTSLRRLGVDLAYAVRSSSTFEDLAQAAFAGQHDTYLNVRGGEAILEKVRHCFVSLWEDRAVLYRHHQGFAQVDASMAAVVQRQIECERAGVGFSIHPVSGRIDRLVIDANYGLGESVVGGQCEVDHFVLDKQSLQVLERAIGHKEQMVVAVPGGVEERGVAADQADISCLSDEQLAVVATLLKKVEAHYRWPQDIEWGLRGGQLYQFQSRPVTTIPPRWTRDESAERFPNPTTPLTWDFIRVAFRGSMEHSMALMGLPPVTGDWFELFDNYVYGNQNAVDLVASFRPLRARSVPDLIAELPELRRRYAWVHDLPVQWARDLDRYLIRLGQLSEVPLEGRSAVELWAHMLRLLEVAAEYFRPNIAISVTTAFLHKLLHALVTLTVGPDRALAVVDGLLAGCETKTAVVNRELHGLAHLLGKAPALRAFLLERGGRAFWDEKQGERVPEFATRFARFLEDHGHRELDMDYFHPTWAGQPWVVLDTLALILRGADADPAETARQLRQRHSETELRFLTSLPEQLRFFFRELIRLARTYTTLDDLEHYQTTRVNPVARRVALELGERLRDLGALQSPEDVFFLHQQEVADLVHPGGGANAAELKRHAEDRKRSYEASRSQPPAWTRGEGSIERPDDGQSFRGLPGSPGRCTGPCFRVTMPEDFARFPKGAVLVARTTNPAWTPLFYSAAGLITESGGPLSHGAVTAREMRLPAVMSVRRAMTLFADGQVVTVDGTQGVVRVEG